MDTERLVERNFTRCSSWIIDSLHDEEIKNALSEIPDYEGELESEGWQIEDLQDGYFLIFKNYGDYFLVFDSGNNITEIIKDSEDYDELKNSNLDYFLDYQIPAINLQKKLSQLCSHLNLEPEYLEIMEHWFVSDFLAKKLREKGERVVQIEGDYVWGRACSGQHLKHDLVIQQIAKELPY